jgi:hypothetical protein
VGHERGQALIPDPVLQWRYAWAAIVIDHELLQVAQSTELLALNTLLHVEHDWELFNKLSASTASISHAADLIS